jgi:hypothetical protein
MPQAKTSARELRNSPWDSVQADGDRFLRATLDSPWAFVRYPRKACCDADRGVEQHKKDSSDWYQVSNMICVIFERRLGENLGRDTQRVIDGNTARGTKGIIHHHYSL